MRPRNFLIILCVGVLVVSGSFIYDHVKDPVVFIYVKNNSFDLPEVDMRIKLDSIIVADTLFVEKEELSEGRLYEIQSEDGTHVLNVISPSMNLIATDSFETTSDMYVLVDFYYKQKGTHRYESARQQFDRLSRRDPDTVMKSDTIEIQPNIRIRITDEKPELKAD